VGGSGFSGRGALTRVFCHHLVATGAVAVGDDMLELILGGTIAGETVGAALAEGW